jgi:membrane protein
MRTSATDADVPPSHESPVPGSAEAAARASAQAALSRLPPRMRRSVARLLSRWPGRIVFRSAASCVHIEIFDRSMTIAAQFFTSVFPILILIATWVGDANTSRLADAVSLPEESRSVLDQAVQDPEAATFGIVGALIVLGSATSLSRALTRAYAAIWNLPRPRSDLRSAWRWLAVVVTLALSLIVVRAVSGFAAGVPPGNVWQRVVAVICDVALTVFVPWLLLKGAVRIRYLAPGAVIFALVMVALRPASAVWLPRALEVSADRYGSIGVAFTYLAWLYVVSFCVLLTAVLGQVIAVDPGWLGRWISGRSEADPLAGAQAV